MVVVCGAGVANVIGTFVVEGGPRKGAKYMFGSGVANVSDTCTETSVETDSGAGLKNVLGVGVANVVGACVEMVTEGGVKYVRGAGVVVTKALVEVGAERDVENVLRVGVGNALGVCVKSGIGTGEELDLETSAGNVSGAHVD